MKMKLEDIGFYTLSNERAENSSLTSPLYRCEMLLTDKCNFRCPYCRGLSKGGDLPFKEAKRILHYWISEGLRNVRFSGGEPTLYPHLLSLVKIATHSKIEHIAISTNGSADFNFYKRLIDGGVNDFSISLDACCSSTGDTIAGKRGVWKKVIKNIELISALSYTTVGIVITEQNKTEAVKTIELAHKLEVSDIRIIPSSLYNKSLQLKISENILNVHPILKYRLANKRHLRGLHRTDTRKCKLVLDDMAVWRGFHYPCIIFLREGGKPIGYMDSRTRHDRMDWYVVHDSWENEICRKNCLDVCIAFNNKAQELTEIQKELL